MNGIPIAIFLGLALGHLKSQKPSSSILQTHDSNKIEIPVGGNSYADNGAVITAEGLTNWTNDTTICRTFIRLNRSGQLKVSFKIKAEDGNNVIRITVLGKAIQLTISGNLETEIFAGEWSIANRGYISIDIQGVTKTSPTFGILSNLYISGSSVTDGVTYVPTNDNNMFYWGRRGTSLWLIHDTMDVDNIEYYYSEITVPSGYDAVGSFFMANGFGEGYFGIQVVSPTERWVLFSVWSPSPADDPSAIPPEDQVILDRKGKDVVTGSFGHEGSGGKSYLVYNWKANNTYGFLVKANPLKNNYTQYTAWFFAPEENKWALIASWKRPKTSTHLKSLCSFIENFLPETGLNTRMAYYGNQWVKPVKSSWRELTRSSVTGSPESKYRLDYAGGIMNGAYYLKIAGYFNEFVPLNQTYTRQPRRTRPGVDLSTLP